MIKVNFSQRLISQQINILKLRHLTAGMAIDEARNQVLGWSAFGAVALANPKGRSIAGHWIKKLVKRGT